MSVGLEPVHVGGGDATSSTVYKQNPPTGSAHTLNWLLLSGFTLAQTRRVGFFSSLMEEVHGSASDWPRPRGRAQMAMGSLLVKVHSHMMPSPLGGWDDGNRTRVSQ